MLTLSRLGSSGRGPGYYLSLTASSYYLDAPEPGGIWYGLGAEEFQLKGEVKPDDLISMCEGYDPRDSTRHVRNAGKEGRYSGDDLCFGAPKSVSVAWWGRSLIRQRFRSFDRQRSGFLFPARR